MRNLFILGFIVLSTWAWPAEQESKDNGARRRTRAIEDQDLRAHCNTLNSKIEIYQELLQRQDLPSPFPKDPKEIEIRKRDIKDTISRLRTDLQDTEKRLG